MIGTRLGEEQLGPGRGVDPGSLRQHRNVLADKILVRRSVPAASALPFWEDERSLCQRVELRAVRLNGSVAFHRGHERIRDTV